MRTEDDLRAAFAELERYAPEPARVLPGERRTGRSRRPAWRLAIAAPVALGLAAAVTVALLPSSPPGPSRPPAAAGHPNPAAELLADHAAAAALNVPAVSPGHWVYEMIKNLTLGHARTGTQNGWMTADGNISDGAGSVGNPIYPYAKLGSLPRDPARLDAYFDSLDPVKTDNKSVVEFSQIEQMLFGMVLPPALKAEMFHALALIPTIQVQDHVKDIAGRAGVAFVLPTTRQSEKAEIILDASTYQLIAQASWDNPSQPRPDNETAILKEYLVAEDGSTQPSAAPPSAAELTAERIDYFQEHVSKQSRINGVAPGHWLYRELRANGQDQRIWATADDSAQAQYVHGALRVCHRADPCAATEPWLMPVGPSFSQLSGNLPEYPRPLLDKLNTYRTGCADAAGDCNAVAVTANMLTGYGNYPFPNATWFYALADVPGVSVRHLTDVAGREDIAFTFPAHDGVTAILLNNRLLNDGTIQYDGYVRDGKQTLVLDQALVSGPGVRP